MGSCAICIIHTYSSHPQNHSHVDYLEFVCQAIHCPFWIENTNSSWSEALILQHWWSWKICVFLDGRWHSHSQLIRQADFAEQTYFELTCSAEASTSFPTKKRITSTLSCRQKAGWNHSRKYEYIVFWGQRKAETYGAQRAETRLPRPQAYQTVRKNIDFGHP